MENFDYENLLLRMYILRRSGPGGVQHCEHRRGRQEAGKQFQEYQEESIYLDWFDTLNAARAQAEGIRLA